MYRSARPVAPGGNGFGLFSRFAGPVDLPNRPSPEASRSPASPCESRTPSTAVAQGAQHRRGLGTRGQRLVTEALPALTGIPECDHDPAIIGRAGCVIGLALGEAAVGGLDAGDRCFVLLLRAAGKPVNDPESRHVASQISTPTVVADPNPSASRARQGHSETRSKRCVVGFAQREPRPPCLRKSRSASVGARAAARS